MSTALEVTRGVLATLVDLCEERLALVEDLEMMLSNVRRFVPEAQWGPAAEAVGKLRVCEERARRVRGEARRQLERLTSPS